MKKLLQEPYQAALVDGLQVMAQEMEKVNQLWVFFGAGGGAIIGDKIEEKYFTENKRTEKCSEINRNENVINGFLTKFRFKNKESELVTSNQYRKGNKIFIGIND